MTYSFAEVLSQASGLGFSAHAAAPYLAAPQEANQKQCSARNDTKGVGRLGLAAKEIFEERMSWTGERIGNSDRSPGELVLQIF